MIFPPVAAGSYKEGKSWEIAGKATTDDLGDSKLYRAHDDGTNEFIAKEERLPVRTEH